MSLAHLRVLLTGATGGIGRATARELSARGAALLLTGRDADALEREWPPQVIEHYGPLIRALRKAAADSSRRASPAERVARDVVHAFTASRPRTRYRMGRDSGIQRWISRLPDRWADALLRKALRL